MKASITRALFSYVLAFIFCLSAQTTHAKTSQSYVNKLTSTPSSSLLVGSLKESNYYQHNIDQPLVPASTMKILTAFMALKRWGPYHHFHTDILLDKDNFLWVKGYGDPYMVSEELSLMAKAIATRLRSRGISSIKGIVIDDTFFHPYASQLDIKRSLNPYDAPLGATSVNFNSIGYRKYKGEITSSEIQTPLTSISYAISDLTGSGKHRVSLRNADQARQHYKELLSYKLQEESISISFQTQKRQSSMLPVLYRHFNSRSLQDVVISMLKYSNNFIANQLFLAMAVDARSTANQTATLALSQQYAQRFIAKHFQWRNYQVADGAGLSRENRLSARQMKDLLKKFSPYADLLPCIHDRKVCAKTGTLSDVHTYAGYFIKYKELYPFVIFAQQKMPYKFRKHMARSLFDDLFK